MKQEILETRAIIEKQLSAIANPSDLEQFRLQHLVRKGTLATLTDRLRDVPKEQKPEIGKELNFLRQFTEGKFKEFTEKFEQLQSSTPSLDVTLPGRCSHFGGSHPVRKSLEEIVSIFTKMGFSVAEGPDVENDEHNFEALNFAADHPARDMQDTFFLETPDGKTLLRTHTSPVQVRIMRSQKPPIRSIMPGRVYRNEAVSARALAEFHQVEGLYIDKNVSFAELKGTLVTFAKQFYGNSVKYKFRPSYFPFTEPSAEMDITCFLCNGNGCRVCKYSGWLEIAGSGMVHPNVLSNCGIDPEEYSGFAFGFGIERTLMLKTDIDDIRYLYENDVRILRQLA